MLRLLYFAWVREKIGLADETLELDGPLPLTALLEHLAARSPGHALALADPSRLRFALNHEYVDSSASVQPGDELALFPPVTGG